MKKQFYLIDCCGDWNEECNPIPEQYQTMEAAEQYGKDYFQSLEQWQKDLRTEFYVAFGTFNRRKYSFNFTECIDCMEG